MIFPSLVQYKPGAEEFEGDLADSWEQSADGKTITFTLKTSGKWSDGKPITAADAALTVNTTLKYVDDADRGDGRRGAAHRQGHAPDRGARW